MNLLQSTYRFIQLIYTKLYVRLGLLFLVGLAATFLYFDLTAPKIPVFGFHSLINLQNPNDRPFLKSSFKQMNYQRQDFEKFLGYLMHHNFWFLTSEELYNYFIIKSKQIPAEHVGQKPIMLSFDDGYKNIYTNLIYSLERLEKKYERKIKVVLFINPGTLADYVSNASEHMTCNDLRDGFKQGFYDIQSHGLTHKNLTKINDRDLLAELGQAQSNLRKCIADLDPEKKVANHIAYPYGASNSKVEEYASQYYLSGYLYNSKIMKLPQLGNHYKISRITVNDTHSPERLIKMAEKALKIKA